MSLLACATSNLHSYYTASNMDNKVATMSNTGTTFASDDEDDVEALRMAALNTMSRFKQKSNPSNVTSSKRTNQQKPGYRYNYSSSGRGHYQNRSQRLNGSKGFGAAKGHFHHVNRNPNLIEIVPMVDQSTNPSTKSETREASATEALEEGATQSTKFERLNELSSASEEEDGREEEDVKGNKDKTSEKEAEVSDRENKARDEDSRSEMSNVSSISPDLEDDLLNGSLEEDDDVLLMADKEEEDSLDRLIHEMGLETARPNNEQVSKNPKSQRSKSPGAKKVAAESNFQSSERRKSLSPKYRSRTRRRSLSRRRSPRRETRSPRRSPRKSPVRKSPLRKSPMRKSPVRKSPLRKSPIRKSPIRKSPLRKSPLRKSPVRKSPIRRSSPRRSPLRRLSPRRLSPVRRSPKDYRTLSPSHSKLSGRSPVSRRISPKHRQPSPRRSSLSPGNSSWSSPRDRRSASFKSWSQERELKKPSSYEHSPSLEKQEAMKEASLSPERTDKKASPETDAILDPVMEARKRKFESSVPIGLINKKIKLSKKEIKDDLLDNNEPLEEEKMKVDETQKKTGKTEKTRVDEIEEDAILLDASFEVDLLENTYNEEPLEDNDNEVADVDVCVTVDNKTEEISSSRTSTKKKSKKRKKDKEVYHVSKFKDLPLSERIGKEKKVEDASIFTSIEDLAKNKDGDVRAWLSKKRAERMNRTTAVPMQSARLLQSAFKGVVKEAVQSNVKTNERRVFKEGKINLGRHKVTLEEPRRVTVIHRSTSEDESKLPIHLRLGVSKSVPDNEQKSSRSSKRQNRKGKHRSTAIDLQNTL